MERKKETQRLLEEEDSRLKGGKAPRVAPAKVTRAQIEDSLRREQRVESGACGMGTGPRVAHPQGLGPPLGAHIPPLSSAVEKAKSHLELPLEENLNRRLQEEGSLEARTVEDAIAVLRWAGPEAGGMVGAEPCRHGWGPSLRLWALTPDPIVWQRMQTGTLSAACVQPSPHSRRYNCRG